VRLNIFIITVRKIILKIGLSFVCLQQINILSLANELTSKDIKESVD